jgi:hypothetical protein
MASSLSDCPSTDQLLSALSKAKTQQTAILSSCESLNTDEMLKNLAQMKMEGGDGRLIVRINKSVLTKCHVL